MDLYGDAEVAVAEMVEKLMRDTIRDDESVLPHIYPAEKEYYLSSIFVEAETPLVKPRVPRNLPFFFVTVLVSYLHVYFSAL